MPGNLSDFLDPGFPTFSGYLSPDLGPPISSKPVDIPATGEGNWLTSGLMAGIHGGATAGARALQAGAQLFGATDVAKSISDFAEREHAREQSYARADLEEHPWSLPGIGYQIARMVPASLAALGGSAVGGALAPEAATAGLLAATARAVGPKLLGASAAMFPLAAGENVQRQVTERGELTQPGKALALGVPEAIVQGWLPGRLEKYFGEAVLKGTLKDHLKEIGLAAATQGGAGGATEAMTQLMGDPNRGFADRASAVVHSALSGAAIGGIVGGAFGGFRHLVGEPTADVLDNPKAQVAAIDQVIGPERQLPPPPFGPHSNLTDRPLPGEPVPGPPPLHEMPALELWQRLNAVQQQLKVSPDDPVALNASKLLGEEFARRSAEMGPAPAVPEPAAPEPPAPVVPEQLGLPLKIETPIEPVPGAARQFTLPLTELIDSLTPPRNQAEAIERRQYVEELQRLTAERTASHLPGIWDQARNIVRPEPAGERAPSVLPSGEPVQMPPVSPGGAPGRGMEIWQPPAAEAPREPLADTAPGEPGDVVPAAGGPAPAPKPIVDFNARLTSQKFFERKLKEINDASPEVQDDFRKELAGIFAEREAAGLKISGSLKKWGKGLDILDEDGKLLDEFKEAPAEVTEEAAPAAAPEAPSAVVPEAMSEVPAPAASVEDTGILDFLKVANREQPAVPEEALAPDAPVDRKLALSGIKSQIAKITDPAILDKVVPQAEALDKLLNGTEKNPGAAATFDNRLELLRSAVDEARQQPADHVAPTLEPTPRAEAVPAPAGDLDERLETAQSELSKLGKVLPSLKDAIAQDSKWLADITNAVGPRELRKALANIPEKLAADGKLNPTQTNRLAAYNNARERVIQELSAQANVRARVIASRDGLPVNQLDADVADHAARGVSAVDAADHIVNHIPDAEQAEIVAKLRDALPEDTKLVFRDGVTDKEGEYFPKQKTIALYNAADSTTTFIHEAVHAVLSRALEGTSAAARAMRGIYDQIKDTDSHAGITDAHEMVAEAQANPVYRAWMKSQMVRGTSLWDRFVDAARSAIGLDPRLYNAFDRIMSHGDDLIKEQKAYPNEWMGPDSYARVADAGTKTAAALGDQGEIGLKQKILEGLLPARGGARRFWNQFTRGEWFAQDPVYAKLSPNLVSIVDTLKKEDPRRDQLARAAVVAKRVSDALSKPVREDVSRTMSASTSYGYLPGKSLADYEGIRNNPDEVQKFNDVQSLWSMLGKFPGAREAYNIWRQTLSAYGHMSAVLNLQAAERTIPGLGSYDAFDRFHGSELGNNPKALDEHWQAELNNKIKAGNDFVAKLSTDKAALDAKIAEFQKDNKADPKELKEQRDELGSQIERFDTALKEAEGLQKRMAKEPYFHLGRHGDYFVAGKLAMKPGAIDPETGKPSYQVDKDKLSALRDHLDANKITDIELLQGNENDSFYVRVKNEQEMAALARILKDAQTKGLMAKEEIARGSILDPHIFERISSKGMEAALEYAKKNAPVAPEGASPEQIEKLNASHSEYIKNLQRILLNMTPETSMSRLMARRQNVQGFSKDMLNSQAFAADASVYSIARQSLAHETRAFEAGMLKDAEKANKDPTVSDNNKVALSDAISEIMAQQRARQTYVPKGVWDYLRQLTNFLHIGMSPAYTLMNTGQLVMTGVPELAKLHGSGLSGYGPAFGAMRQALAPSLQALAAVIKSPDRLTATFTREDLNKSGLGKETINDIIGMAQRGSLGSSYSAGVTEHSRLASTAEKVANVMGLYSDTAPRLIMGLAAATLYDTKFGKNNPHPTMTREQFIDQAIEQSQGYYGGSLGARFTSKGGPLGPAAPMATQFMQWNLNITNKIYREVYDAFKGADAQTKQDARTWLAGHAAATTMLAGTLGLPVVSAAASTYDWVANKLFGQDNADITASYRNFLASAFGKDIGEIIARGVPRAAGVDLANWGESDIIPGSSILKVLTEKRKLEDMEGDLFKNMAGPAADQIFQFAKAARDITNGDYLDGLIKMMPGLISAPLKAYQLSDQGFVDQHGQKLPISNPTTRDYILTVLGLKPQKLAEQQELAREASGLRTMREASSANISQHLRQAYMAHDRDAFNSWMGAAQQWQAQHPNLMPPQASFERTLGLHLQQLQQARGMGLPIGVQPQDVATRRQLSYGNLQ